MKMVEQIEPLLDVHEAAGVLGVSPYTVRAWIRSGVLQATKLGRLVRVEPGEVQRLIAHGRTSKVENRDRPQCGIGQMGEEAREPE